MYFIWASFGLTGAHFGDGTVGITDGGKKQPVEAFYGEASAIF
jgi:hypothetical protein